MELWAELKPSLKRDKLIDKAKKVSQYASWVNVPDSPLGKPIVHAVAVAHVVKEASNIKVAANFRLLDVNWNAFMSLAAAALLLDVDALIVLQGDPPALGEPVGQVTTEEAVQVLKRHEELRRLQVGVLVSMAKPVDRIRRRLQGLPVDLVLVTRLSSPAQCDVLQEARRRGVRVIPYVVVARGEDKAVVERLLKGHQVVFTPEEALNFVEALEGLVDGVLISAPLGFDVMLETLRRLSKK